MNRPTRDILFGSVLCLVLVSLPVCSTRAAQIEEQAKTVRKNFDDCFYSSALSQVKRNTNPDINLVSEQAFQACATEEQAMLGFLALNNTSQNAALVLITGIKLQLKKALRDIAANPAKYAN